jgi:hypothetical protein
MAGTTAFALSRRFSQLVGRKVTFVQSLPTPASKLAQIYGIYTVLPQKSAVVVKGDLRLLGSIAGALVGLPDPEVMNHLAANPMEELMRDAIYEVLNIAAATISTEGRAVFTKMVTDPTLIEGVAEETLKKPFRRSYFSVSMDGYQGGTFCIFSQFVPLEVAQP